MRDSIDDLRRRAGIIESRYDSANQFEQEREAELRSQLKQVGVDIELDGDVRVQFDPKRGIVFEQIDLGDIEVELNLLGKLAERHFILETSTIEVVETSVGYGLQINTVWTTPNGQLENHDG